MWPWQRANMAPYTHEENKHHAYSQRSCEKAKNDCKLAFMLYQTSLFLLKPTEHRFQHAYKCSTNVIAIIFYCLLSARKKDPALALAAGDFSALKHLPVYFLSPLWWKADDKGNKLGDPEPGHAGSSSCLEQIISTVWGDFLSLVLLKIGLLDGADMLTGVTQTGER